MDGFLFLYKLFLQVINISIKGTHLGLNILDHYQSLLVQYFTPAGYVVFLH